MIVRIPKWRSVGDHDAGVTVLPKWPLIRPADAGNKPGKRCAFGWNLCLLAEKRDDAAKQRTRTNIADESDEVANLRIESAQRPRRISLRVRCIGKIADRFETDHGGDFVAARFASAGVNKASHFARQKIRRLLVHKRDEAQGVFCLSTGKAPCQSEHCSHAAAVIVCARRTKH